MTMNSSSHSPETIIVEEANVLRLGVAGALLLRVAPPAAACWLLRNIVTVL